MEIFAANIAVSFTFRIREFTTWASKIPCVFPVFCQNFQIPCVFPDREFFWPFSLFSLCCGYPGHRNIGAFRGVGYTVGDHYRHFPGKCVEERLCLTRNNWYNIQLKKKLPKISHGYPIPPADGLNDVCDLSQKFQKQVADVSLQIFYIYIKIPSLCSLTFQTPKSHRTIWGSVTVGDHCRHFIILLGPLSICNNVIWYHHMMIEVSFATCWKRVKNRLLMFPCRFLSFDCGEFWRLS